MTDAPFSAAEPSSTGLDGNLAAALAYLAGPLSGVIILVAERTSLFVRFHAWQAIVGLGAIWALGLFLYVLAFAALFVSATAFRTLLWFAALVWAGWLVVWVICLVKAFTGSAWRMPLFGSYAARRAAAASPRST